ncbi:ABC transporter permease [Hephaestia mangrovi]|uniref:ABC transporter permease n=1 Tax=Hephaestia mangrovi TaxID=2873268 RepID=UPI001CA6537D|nr:ABC transporter permease [Hephaestia mangrovi]MBY8826545.1 ABC transporter permease [Hephaestia mangrovi]
MSRALDRRRLVAMLVKETRQIVRDPSTFLIAFVMPLLLLFLLGYAVNLDTPRTRIGISPQDDSAAAQSLASAYRASRWFSVAEVGDVATLGNDMARQRIRGIVVIPVDFGRNAARGGGTIQVITDGSSPNMAAFVAAYARGVYAIWAGQRAADRDPGGRAVPAIATVDRFWFNPALTSRYFLVPGSIAVVMTIIGTLLTALVVAREWERGTLEAIMATPLGMGEFIATKVIPYFLLGLGSMALCTLLAVTVFQVPLRGSPLALLAIAASFLFPALGQGLLISAATRNQFVASQVALLSAFLPTMLLSGFLFEIASMPAWVRPVTYLVPARYLIPQLQTVFVAGDDWSLFLPDMAVLIGFGLLFFALALRATRRRIA